jgi:hypothetical protein
MAEGREEKEFQQFNWWRAKVCPLGLHMGGRRTKENALQNAYMAALFESFDAKSFSSRPRVWARQEWKPELWSRGGTMAPRVSPLG